MTENSVSLEGLASAVGHAFRFLEGNNGAFHIVEAGLDAAGDVLHTKLRLKSLLKKHEAGILAAHVVGFRHKLVEVLVVLLDKFVVDVLVLHYYYNY